MGKKNKYFSRLLYSVNVMDWKNGSFYSLAGSPGSSPGDQVPGVGSK